MDRQPFRVTLATIATFAFLIFALISLLSGCAGPLQTGAAPTAEVVPTAPTLEPTTAPTAAPVAEIVVGFTPGAADATIKADAPFLYLNDYTYIGGKAVCFVAVPYRDANGDAQEARVWGDCGELNIAAPTPTPVPQLAIDPAPIVQPAAAPVLAAAPPPAPIFPTATTAAPTLTPQPTPCPPPFTVAGCAPAAGPNLVEVQP